MFLFVIGLEMQPSRLWSLRREIFGLGVAQVATCGALLTRVGVARRLSADGGVPRRHGLRALLHRHRRADPGGARRHRDARGPAAGVDPAARGSRHRAAAGAGRVPGAGARRRPPAARAGSRSASRSPRSRRCSAAGRWLLNPMFRVLADAQAREVMTAAALLVVLGAALVMQLSGLSMAMGAFLAGVLLSESTLPPSARGRHRAVPRHPARAVLPRRRHVARPRRDRAPLAADPRRRAGLHARQVGRHLHRRAAVPASATARRSTAPSLLAQGGEFAFVLYAAAAAVGLFDATTQRDRSPRP